MVFQREGKDRQLSNRGRRTNLSNHYNHYKNIFKHQNYTFFIRNWFIKKCMLLPPKIIKTVYKGLIPGYIPNSWNLECNLGGFMVSLWAGSNNRRRRTNLANHIYCFYYKNIFKHPKNTFFI